MWDFKARYAGLVSALILAGPLSYADSPGKLVIRSVSLIDGTGALPRGPVDIEIIGNRISRIGPALKSDAGAVAEVGRAGYAYIDATGKTVIPGLIDCHTHIRTVPGSLIRNESDAETTREQVAQLKAYLAAGVTTVLDAATPEALFSEVAAWEKSSRLPRFLGLAPFLTPKGGYFSDEGSRGRLYRDLWPAVDTPSEVHELFQQAKRVRSLGVKVTAEYGFGPLKNWPVFNDTMIRAIVEEAKEAKLPIFVHSMSDAEYELALRFRPYAFMHAGFQDSPVSAARIAQIRESGAYVVSTLAIYKMFMLLWQQDLLDDPWLRMLVPEEELETARSLVARSEVVDALALRNKPGIVPGFLAVAFEGLFFSPSTVARQLAGSERAVREMFRAGIPIVMGSDAGNWPVLTTFFHGVGSILEMEALEEAGLSPLDVITAATSRAAAFLKISESVGTVTEGKVADLVILNQSPLSSPRAFRDVDYVIKDGVAKQPRDWLTQ